MPWKVLAETDSLEISSGYLMGVVLKAPNNKLAVGVKTRFVGTDPVTGEKKPVSKGFSTPGIVLSPENAVALCDHLSQQYAQDVFSFVLPMKAKDINAEANKETMNIFIGFKNSGPVVQRLLLPREDLILVYNLFIEALNLYQVFEKDLVKLEAISELIGVLPGLLG